MFDELLFLAIGAGGPIGTKSALPSMSVSMSISRPNPNGALRFCHERLICIGFSLRWSSSKGSVVESKDVAGVSTKKEVFGVVHADNAFVAADELMDEKLSVEKDLWSVPNGFWCSR